MYSMKPIHQNTDNIEVPSVIYKMKGLHQEVVVDTSSTPTSEINPRMQQLEQRQRSILEKLADLESEVKQISQQLGHKYGDAAPVSSSPLSTKTTNAAKTVTCAPVDLPKGTVDFVISVSNKNPESSFSPMLIGEMLKKRGVDVAFPTHIHSSCKSVIKAGVTQYGALFTGRLNTSVSAKVYFTFVFKEDPFCPSVMYSPLSQTRIIGDVNIARYLCRFLMADLYDEKNIDSVSSIDQWLDVAKKITQGNSKEKDAAMKSLNAHFGKKHAFICFEQLTLADIVNFSAILGNIATFKSLPKNVKPWFQRMASIFDSDFVDRFNIPSGWLSD